MIDKPNIYKEFYDLLAQIPEGYISTYGDLALQLGDIIASRAVGEMLSENDDPDNLPCYRVIMSDGKLGGYTNPNGVEEKVRRLRKDGIRISNGRVENYNRIRFDEFKSNFPLKKFREEVNRIDLEKEDELYERVVALDISYSGRRGVGVAVDFQDDLSYEVAVREAKSPYIPNYLYLREGEILEMLVKKEAVNVIDGNGMIHRDGRGIATLVGVSKNVETVGIAKSLLIGHEREGDIILGAKKIGKRIGKYFVSKGYLADLESSVQFLTNEGHFPQTKYADRLSRRYKDEILPAQDSI
jgi:O-6-methylguanine DNA methyltransferase